MSEQQQTLSNRLMDAFASVESPLDWFDAWTLSLVKETAKLEARAEKAVAALRSIEASEGPDGSLTGSDAWRMQRYAKEALEELE